MNSAKSKWIYALYMAPFVIISLFAVFHHEPSRDEVQDFMAIIDTSSLQEVYHWAKCYSSSGILFSFLMKIATYFSNEYICLAIFCWIIAFGNVLLVFMCSRFHLHEKILISLGYFFLYDYCIYLRSYGLTVFTVFATLSIYPWRQQYPRLTALFAALPSLTNIPGVVISLPLVGLLGGDFLRNKRNLVNLLVAVAVILFSIFMLLPPMGTQHKPWLTSDSYPLPDPTTAYYTVKGIISRIFLTVTNSDMYYFPHVAVDRPHYSLLLALIFLTLTFIVAPRRLLPMAFFWTASSIFMGLLVLRPGSGIRHQGFLIIALLSGVWLERLYEKEKPLFTIRYLHHPTVIKLAFTVILTLQAWSGLNAVYIDYKHPNSLSTSAAEFLQHDMTPIPPERTLFATFLSSVTSPIVTLMPPKTEFYSIEWERPYRCIPGASAEWLAVDSYGRSDMYTMQTIIERFLKEVNSGKYDRFYLILPFPIQVNLNNAVLRLVHAPATRMVITGDEVFFIYRLEPLKQS